MFNVILFTDTAEFATKTRGYGVHRLASHIRNNGYTCIVIDFASAIDYSLYTQLLDLIVGPDTYMIGYSTSWMPFRLPGEPPQTMDPGMIYRRKSDAEQFDLIEGSRFKGTLVTAFANGNADVWLEYPKQLNANVKITFGGTKIDQYMDSSLVDYYIIGLAETMTIDLLDSLSGRGKKRIFNRVIDHDTKAQLPVWDFRASKTQYTDYDFITKQEALSLEVSRGCRFKCSFCSYPLIGQKNMSDYTKYPDVIREELLENYNKWGVTRYYFMDDTFNDTTEKLEMMLSITRSLPFKISFWCYLRLDLLATHPEQIPMLKEMGLAQCYFGVETFNSKTSKSVGKGMSAVKQKAALTLCKEVWGDTVSIQSGFIVGMPYETEASVAETAAYLSSEDCPIDIPWMFPLSIVGDHAITKYVYKSEFDRNHLKYGYYFKDPDRPWEWYKDDDTDINDFLTAAEIAAKYDRTIKRKKLYKGNLYLASLNHPVLSDREKTLSMTDIEYKELVDSIDQTALYYETVLEQYFNPLLEKLRGANV